jgi:hypothetical protein
MLIDLNSLYMIDLIMHNQIDINTGCINKGLMAYGIFHL